MNFLIPFLKTDILKELNPNLKWTLLLRVSKAELLKEEDQSTRTSPSALKLEASVISPPFDA